MESSSTLSTTDMESGAHWADFLIPSDLEVSASPSQGPSFFPWETTMLAKTAQS